LITRSTIDLFMLNYIWFGLILISVVVGTITGRIDQVTEAAISMSKTSRRNSYRLNWYYGALARYNENC